MIVINGNRYQGSVVYCANSRGDLSATFTGGLSDEEITAVLNATEIREVNDFTQETIAIYALVHWRGMERNGNDLTVLWQTYVHDDVENLKTDNEDLTQAVLELAAIIGGDGNG